MQLCEQYRPDSWARVIGQAKARSIIDALRARGLAGRAYWLSGPSGVGKTTIGRLIASELAEPDFIQELDATDLSAAMLRTFERQSYLYAPGKGGRVFVVNEAHGLSKPAIRQLLTLLERIPGHVAWIFTTTLDGQDSLFEDQIDAHPLLSRCTVLPLTSQGLAKPGAVRLLEIANAEGLRNGQTDEELLKRLTRIIHEAKGNLRAALQRVEEGALL